MAQNLFTSQIPSSTDVNDSHVYTLGTVIIPAVGGSVTAGRWYFPTTLPSGTTQFVLYDLVAQTELARKAFVAPIPGTWNSTTLTSPVLLTSARAYIACVVTNDHYVAQANFFAGVGITQGDLRAPVTTEIANGRFLDGSDGFPTGSFGGGCYFVDFTFEPTPIVVPPDPVPPVVVVGGHGGWNSLLDTQRLSEQFLQEESLDPQACPRDGEPLGSNSAGVLHCPFCGYTYQG